MRLQEEKLQEKGWTEEEIAHAKTILLRAEEKKHPKKLFLEKTLYWIMLLIIIVGTMLGAWVVEPLILVSTTTQAIIGIFIFGLLFGSLATILFRDIEELELHQHIISSLIIPLTAIITSIILTRQTIKMAIALSIDATHNPILLGVTYSIGALLPYLVFITLQRKTHATNSLA